MASFATSYIPTTSAQVTRNADQAVMTGTNFSSWYNASAGTFYWEGDSNTPVSTTNISVLAGSGNNQIAGYFNNKGVPSTYNGTTLLAGSSTVPAAKLIVAYDSAGRSVCGNAGTVATDANVFGTNTQMLLGAPTGVFVNYLNGHIRTIRYYSQRLPNTTLQSLTA